MKKDKFIPTSEFLNLVPSMNEFYRIIHQNDKVIVLFTSSDKKCVTCQKYNKVFDELTKPLQTNYKVLSVVCSKHALSPICAKNNIKSVPQIRIFKYAQTEEFEPGFKTTTKNLEKIMKQPELKITTKEKLTKFQKENDAWNFNFRRVVKNDHFIISLNLYELFDSTIMEPSIELYKPNSKKPIILKADNFNMMKQFVIKNIIPGHITLKEFQDNQYQQSGLPFIAISYESVKKYNKMIKPAVEEISKAKKNQAIFFSYSDDENSHELPEYLRAICKKIDGFTMMALDTEIQHVRCFHGSKLDRNSIISWVNQLITKQIRIKEELTENEGFSAEEYTADEEREEFHGNREEKGSNKHQGVE
eukprot:gene8558-381_t